MKKLFAVMMALCLMLTAVAAFAADTGATAVNWADHEADAAKVEGKFANVPNTGLKMFIPAEFKDTEIPKENQEKGTILVLKSDKEEKAVVNAQVVSVDMASFKAKLQSEGKTVWDMVVNGLPAIQFSIEAEGAVTSCFGFSTEQGGVLMFSLTLANQGPYTGLYKLMVSSIQRAQ